MTKDVATFFSAKEKFSLNYSCLVNFCFFFRAGLTAKGWNMTLQISLKTTIIKFIWAESIMEGEMSAS